jgi:DNA-binding NarL/FixJ family response regulator
MWDGAAWYGVFEGLLQATVVVPKCKHTNFLEAAGQSANLWRKMCFSNHAGRERTDKKRDSGGEDAVIGLDGMKVTPRDQQVLNLLVQGCSNKEIAGQLNISPRTVKQHLRTLFLRAGIRDGRKRVKLATAVFEREEVRS